VFYGPRTDFISANREGVVSSCGYLAICMIGIEFGRNIFVALFEKEKKDKLDLTHVYKKEFYLFLKLSL
jgi:hypothetical protein